MRNLKVEVKGLRTYNYIKAKIQPYKCNYIKMSIGESMVFAFEIP